MPHIFDNSELNLLPTLRDALGLATRADFCVGYFNLRGCRELDALVEQFRGDEDSRCRLLIGMQSLPQDEVCAAFQRARAGGQRGVGVDVTPAHPGDRMSLVSGRI